MGCLFCAAYLAALGVLSFLLGRLVPKKLFHPDRGLFRSFPFEENGKLYERALHISRWQARVPDMSRLFPQLMPAKRLSARPDEKTLLLMLLETCVAECVHAVLCLLGLGCLLLWPGAGGVCVYLVYSLLGNIPFILIQRYERPRLLRLYARMQRKGGERSQ